MAAIRIHMILSSTKVDLPELAPLVGHRVEVLVQGAASASWPDGWFDAVEGAIQDPTFCAASTTRYPATCWNFMQFLWVRLVDTNYLH
jgi:hypothetical protein